MKNVITNVIPDSIAEEVGIEVNDILLSINGEKIVDIIDYRFLAADEEIVLEIEKPNGEVWDYEIEKEYGEELGLEFGGGIMDKAKRCSNNCMFCFIDQLPKGMRETLYFKDDDSRLSFLQGNFVTLTNMKDEDIERIIRYRISPINISVHTTNPELRVKMLGNRFAGQIYERMKKLADAGIEMHCQIVLIPDVNNGEELKKTINDLYKLYPSVANVAVVPIGVTKYRDGLAKVKTFNQEIAKSELEMVMKLQEKFIEEKSDPFVRMSDEFYIVSGIDVPEESFYNGYEQIEDGVGMIRCFREAIDNTIADLNKNISGRFAIPTGKLAYKEIFDAASKIMKVNSNIKVEIFEIINHFFGETITVTGLITGRDIIKQLKGKINSDYLIMSNNMFRKGYELGDSREYIMLDDIKIGDIEKELGVKVLVCDHTGEDLVSIINKVCQEE
jgi:putative radical SAM enzyme (TIGR03279 family)